MEISELQQLKITRMHIAMKDVGALEEVAGGFLKIFFWAAYGLLTLICL